LTVAAQNATPTQADNPSRHETDSKRAADLIESIEQGDLSRVWRLLEDGVNPDAADDDGRPALQYAVREGRSEIVEALLAHRARVDAEDYHGGSALQAAAGLGNANLVKLLIAYGADVNHSDHGGHTALMCAAFGSTIKSAPAWLAAAMFELDADDDLLSKMGSEHLSVVKALLDAGANVNAQGKDCGLTALMVAAIHGNVAMAKMLLARKPDLQPTNGQSTALQFAELIDSPKKLTEELGEIEGEEQQQAFLNWLHLTAAGRKEVVALLRKAGAK
jgi:ankyrin repeat protein